MSGSEGAAALPSHLVARITQLFNILDQDKNGSLDVKELKFFVRKVMGVADREDSRDISRKMMQSLDQDGDRSIDVLEFVEGLSTMDFEETSLEKFVESALETATARSADGEAKIAERAEVVFRHLDTDSSGSLGIKEIKRFYRKIVGITDKDESRAAAIAFMQSMDVDHGHTLNLVEFTDGFRKMNQGKALAILKNATEVITSRNEKLVRKWAEACFRHLDADDSQSLGIKEIKRFFRKIVGVQGKEESRAAAIEFMQSMDTDNDHELDLDEFVNGFSQMAPVSKAIGILKNAMVVIGTQIDQGQNENQSSDAAVEVVPLDVKNLAVGTSPAAAAAVDPLRSDAAGVNGTPRALATLQRMRWLFNLINVSGTKRLTQEEFCGYLENSVGMESVAAKTAGADLFENLDVDDDRELSPSEFFFGFRMMPLSLRRALIESVPEAATVPRASDGVRSVEGGPALPMGSEERAAAVRRLFAQLDGDGDGVLDVKEVKALFRRVLMVEDAEESRRMSKEFLRLLDSDGDHKVTEQEFLRALEAQDSQQSGRGAKLLAHLLVQLAGE